MEEKFRKNWLLHIFFFLFEKQIETKQKSWFKSFQEIVTLTGALLLTIIGFSFSAKVGLGIVIAIIIAVIDMLLYMGLQRIIDYFDYEATEEAKKNEDEITRYKTELKQIQTELTAQTALNAYYCDLYSNIVALTDEISKANKSQTSKALYTVLGSSIVDMVTSYTGIPKKNFSVHIYGYDASAEMIRRLTVLSFVDSKQKALEKGPFYIKDPVVSKKYYAQVMLDEKKKISKFSTNEEILTNLDFNDEPEEIKKMYTQYAGMVYTVGHGIKLYVEVVSYNGVKLTPEGKSLDAFIEKVIAPFSSPMSNVKWKSVGGDLHA